MDAKRGFCAAALGLALLPSSMAAEPPLIYSTSCALVAPNGADGYVTNGGQGSSYVVSGVVQFIFTADNSISHPAIALSAASIVPAGQTVRVAHVNLSFDPLPGETCRLEVKDALTRAR